MGFILGAMRRGLAGAGEGMELAGMQLLKSQLAEMRDQRLSELQAQRDERQNAFQAGQTDKTIAATKELHEGDRNAAISLERDVRQPFATSERQGREKFEGEQKTEDRKLDARRLAMQERQVNAAVAASGIAVQKGEMEVAALKRVKDLQDAYLSEQDPAKRDAIADQIYTLAGKDKYTPLVGKDAEGNPAYLGAFNTRSGERKTGAPSAGAVDFSQFFSGSGGDLSQPGPTKARAAAEGNASPNPPPQKGLISSGIAGGAPLQTGEAPRIPAGAIAQARERVAQIQRALDTPNLSTDQKAALSLELQKAMREAGTLGQ